MSNDKPETPQGWLQSVQKSQADWMRQWSQWMAPFAPAGTGFPGAQGTPPAVSQPVAKVSTAADAGTALSQRVLGQMEQSLGVSRAMWDLLGRSAALADTGQRVMAFNQGVQQLQSQLGKFFAPLASFAPSAAPSAGMGGLMGMPGFGAPAANSAAAFSPLSMNPMGFGLPWAGLPGVGPASEQQEALERLGSLAQRVMQAQAQLATQWGQVVQKSLQELGSKLSPRLQSGALPGSMREVYDLWVDTAEKVYAGAASGNAFTQAQSEVANSLSQLRIAQRDWLEEWGRAFDLPTRAELNSLHQQVRQLKEAVQKITGKV